MAHICEKILVCSTPRHGTVTYVRRYLYVVHLDMAQISKEIPVYVVNLDMAQICEERPVCSTLRHGTDMSGDSCM